MEIRVMAFNQLIQKCLFEPMTFANCRTMRSGAMGEGSRTSLSAFDYLIRH